MSTRTSALRKTITNERQLSALRAGLKTTLTLEVVHSLFARVVNDDIAVRAVERAIGKKGHKTIRQREVDTLAAAMLGFDNPHEMFAHYQRDYFNLELFRYFDGWYERRMHIAAEQGVFVTILDMIHRYRDDAEEGVAIDLFDHISEFDHQATLNTDLERNAALSSMYYHVDRHSALTGLAFDLSCHSREVWQRGCDHCHAIPDSSAQHHAGMVEWMVESGGCGVSFGQSGEPLLAAMDEKHARVIGVEQADLISAGESVMAIARALVEGFADRVGMLGGATLFYDLIRQAIRHIDSSPATPVHCHNGALHLRVDYQKAVVLFETVSDAGDVTPQLAAGLYMDRNDIRFKGYLSHLS